MAKLTKQQVLHVAKLSKLELTSGQVEKFSRQLSEVLDYISKLDEVDTKDVVPTSQTTGLTDVLRNDKQSLPVRGEIDTTKCLTQEEALSGTEKTKNGFFEVDAILHKDE